MSEERKMILEMLAERKITVEEAAELLRAVGAPVPEGAAESGEQPQAERQTTGQSARQEADAGPAWSRVRSGAAPGKSILEDFLGRLDIDWSTLPLALGGEGYRFEEEQTGEFGPDATIKLDLTARNGRVEVFGWDQPGWRVILRKKIRAQSEERARERLGEVSRFISGPDFLQFEEFPTGLGISGVSAEVHVPRSRRYEVSAVSSNGRVVVEGILANRLYGKTANGKVSVKEVTAQDVVLSTANGGITFAGSAKSLECGTANGTIACCPLAKADMDCRLQTSNGGIRLKLPHDAAVGYEVDAHTSHGSVDVELEQFEVTSQERQFGRRTIRGRSRDYTAKAIKVTVAARTTNGSIRIGNAVPGAEC